MQNLSLLDGILKGCGYILPPQPFFHLGFQMTNCQLKQIQIVLIIFTFVLSCFGQEKSQMTNGSKVRYAGVRSSSYGIRPFPDQAGWQEAMQAMSSYFKGSTPCAIWIVGELSKQHGCRLFFPGDDKKITNVVFKEEDIHEPYLTYFDNTDIKVFLQVEPGNASVDTLIDLVLNRYKHHPCVIGFGIDVEWHGKGEKRGWGIPVTDRQASGWENKVKNYNPDYQLFLKHWDRDWMPPTYRGDIIFVSDSQQLNSLEEMVTEFSEYWADFFRPNPVYFQIGYGSDRKWWKNFETPPRTVGDSIAYKVEQETGIFWVDFTLREVLPTSSSDSLE